METVAAEVEDADLKLITAAWPGMPPERRQAIVALVTGIGPTETPPARCEGYIGPDGLPAGATKSRSRTPRKARR